MCKISAISRIGMASCDSGSISRKSYNRKSYTRKNGIHVRSTHVTARCIKDRGAPGSWTVKHGSRGIGKLRKGRLGAVGYSSKLPVAARYSALNRAVKTYGALAVYRMLNAIYVYTKRTNPTLSAMYKADRNMVGKMAGYGGSN
jgi:hypothetical protein